METVGPGTISQGQMLVVHTRLSGENGQVPGCVLKVELTEFADRLHGSMSEDKGIGQCQEFCPEQQNGWSFIS